MVGSLVDLLASLVDLNQKLSWVTVSYAYLIELARKNQGNRFAVGR
jgi:hypothetical protein